MYIGLQIREVEVGGKLESHVVSHSSYTCMNFQRTYDLQFSSPSRKSNPGGCWFRGSAPKTPEHSPYPPSVHQQQRVAAPFCLPTMCRDVAQPAAKSESGDPANGLGKTHDHFQHPNLDSDKSSIDRFCYQYLQMDPSPEYPAGELLKRAEVQDEMFDRIFAVHAPPPPKTARLQLRALKELVNRIENSISDQESDEFVCNANLPPDIIYPSGKKKKKNQSCANTVFVFVNPKTGRLRQDHGPYWRAHVHATDI